MSASAKLEALSLTGMKVIPIYRKVGPRFLGKAAFTRDEQTEGVMDCLPYLALIVEAAEKAGLVPETIERLDHYLSKAVGL